ncbi:MAG: hypothetical protein QM500_20010, partial [Methylococcales bacterium]
DLISSLFKDEYKSSSINYYNVIGQLYCVFPLLVELRDKHNISIDFMTIVKSMSLSALIDYLNNKKLSSKSRKRVKFYIDSIDGYKKSTSPDEQPEYVQKYFRDNQAFILNLIMTSLPLS